MPRNPNRLSALDSAFLHIERSGAHMHVASVMTFAGSPPAYDELLTALESRLHLVPRYRQRLARVPLDQGRPVWVDDPHFNLRFHVRHAGLPAPGDDAQLRRLAGRLFSQQLDRNRPLWEIWLVEGLSGDRFAIVGKTHHALVDGVSGVDITTVLFDTSPDPAPIPPPERPWAPSPPPSRTELLADALVERATDPVEAYRAARSLVRAPRRVAREAARGASGVGAALSAVVRPAPASPLNVPIGPHRRYTWVDGDLAELKAVKDELGGTVNDVVLTAVSLALGRWLRRHGFETEGVELRALVPVSVRADVERGALGNRVAAMYAPLPVGIGDPEAAHRRVHEAMAGLKESGQAVGAQVITQLGEFAPPTILSQAARLQARQRWFNLVVTNVPGPQFPLYVLGRRLERLYPVVPLAPRQALGVAIMSYDGRLGFGLLGDYDALTDLDDLASDLRTAIGRLARAAGVRGPARPPRGPRRGAARTPVRVS
ncbi:MAG TPA: wax ester/triacylglycerol synthase family O-acyltransferase [Solirubrobacteraceae bacterium]|nr:wax ester/triacylglycerol synthase family O-acyltransferase [Solirubrobacteraceae bacterium]